MLERVVASGKAWREVDSLEEAQGVRFLCPACYAANGGPVGTHSIVCWFRDRGVDDAELPGPARWVATGTGIEDLTLSPSVLVRADRTPEAPRGCVGWHGYVAGGEVRTC